MPKSKARAFKLNSFERLYLTNTLANFHENPSNLHPLLIRVSRGNSRKKKPNFWAAKIFTVLAPHLSAVMPPTNETQHRTPWQVSWKRTPLKFAGKVIFRNWEHELKWNPKFIKKSRRKSAQSKLGKKKNATWIYLARALSRLFSSWPFDKDPYFLTFCEICNKFPFVVQCKTRC